MNVAADIVRRVSSNPSPQTIIERKLHRQSAQSYIKNVSKDQ